ncbi:hypothetical protein LG299_05100 [Microbacterium lacus]|uniref:hypothetical protein n=1 Tax=Microbacterium lacus TaxID=415217 RepID=UPI00384AB722
MRSTRVTMMSVSLLGLAALLAGCSSSGTNYSALDQQVKPGDELPRAIDNGGDEIAADTARFVGEHDGVSLWLARAERPDIVCLIVYANDQDWVTGCGAEGGPIGVGGPSGGYVLSPDGAPTPDGSRQLTDNVDVVTK